MENEINYKFEFFKLDEDLSYSRAQAQICLKNLIKNEGYIKYIVDKRIFTDNRGNFFGKLYEVNIKGETKSEIKEHNLFLKIITPGV